MATEKDFAKEYVRRLRAAQSRELESIAIEIESLSYETYAGGRRLTNAEKLSIVELMRIELQAPSADERIEETNLKGTDNYHYLKVVDALKQLVK